MAEILNFQGSTHRIGVGSFSKVIKKWLKFRETSQTSNNNPTDNLFVLEDIIFEIRKDMGQKKGELKQGDLLAFFVNDIRKYLPQNNNKK